MSEKMIKWGFIGCGEVTKNQKVAPPFKKVEHSEVVAVMSRDGAKAKAYAKERGIRKWYDDAQELIDDPGSKCHLYRHSSFFTRYIRHYGYESRQGLPILKTNGCHL